MNEEFRLGNPTVATSTTADWGKHDLQVFLGVQFSGTKVFESEGQVQKLIPKPKFDTIVKFILETIRFTWTGIRRPFFRFT
jgi:hypothetical protein